MAQAPGADGKEDPGRDGRPAGHQRRWGLLVEDEAKTNLALLVQDAFRGGLASLFYLLPRLFIDVKIYGREHVSEHHPVLIASNHKRDLDSVILVAACYFKQGFPGRYHELAFGIREDLYWPRFLADYVPWPAPLRPLFVHLNIAPVMRLLRAFPIGYVTSSRDLRRVRSQLQSFTDLLERGQDIYWTPEGGRSEDGSFSRIRAGLHRLARSCRAPLRIRPVAIFYDFMTIARTRCFIRFGPEFPVDPAWNRAEIEGRVRQAVLGQMTINIGHLFARVLPDLPERFSRARLSEALLVATRHYAARGCFIDPRLRTRWTFDRRLDELLGYLKQEGILTAQGEDWALDPRRSHPALRYVGNEIAETDSSVRHASG